MQFGKIKELYTRGGEVLIQGDRRDDVRKALADLGFKTKG